MGFVHTLSGFAPVPRLDGVPFVTMELQQSADRVSWLTIASQALVPADLDPSQPATRGITSDQGTLPQCWLRVVFYDAQGDLSASDPIWSHSAGTGLATVEDVRAVMRLRDSSLADDADLARSLSVAASYLSTKLPAYGASGGVVQEFGVSGDQVIRLPFPSATVTAVQVWDADGAAPRLLVPGTDYLVTPNGVRLHGHRFVNIDPRYAPAEGPRGYARVDVTWQGGSDVPEAVREGVALFAASLWGTLPKLSSGMRSERIGDYSYTLGDKDVDTAMPPKALALLKPFMNRRLPFVT